MNRVVTPLDPPRRLLMGSGPSNPEPRVLQAMAAQPPPPGDAEFDSLMDDIVQLGRGVFRTSNQAVLAVPGASRSGIETALASLVEHDDRVLVGVYGHFGELLCSLAARHGGRIERVEAEWGRPVDVESLIEAARRISPKVVAIVHADTSTGILQPIEHIGAACRDIGALFVVDAVLSLGGCEVSVDDWSIDVAIGGLQKCLGGPPGLAPLTFSAAAGARRAGRTVQPRTEYLDLARHAAAWLDRCDLHRYEISGPMLLALHEAWRMINAEGLEARWHRHRRASRALRAGVTAIGLHIFGNAAHAVPMITLVRVPDGISESGVRERLLNEHGVEIMAAFGPLRGQVWRIGTMGTNAHLPSVLAVLSALESVLASSGFRLPRGAAIEAALHEYQSIV